MPNNDFGVFERGKRASAGALNSHSGRLRELTPLIGDGGIVVTGTKAGTSIGLPAEVWGSQFGIIVKISGLVSSQAGRYNARSLLPPKKVTNATGNLAEADLGTLSEVDDFIVWHIPDIGTGVASLAVGDFVGVVPIGRDSNDMMLAVSMGGGGEGQLKLGYARLSGGVAGPVATFTYDLYESITAVVPLAEDVEVDYIRHSVDMSAADINQTCIYRTFVSGGDTFYKIVYIFERIQTHGCVESEFTLTSG